MGAFTGVRQLWPLCSSTSVQPICFAMEQGGRRILLRTISANRLERRPQLCGEQLRLFPRGEVAAFVELVVIDKLGIGLLGPTLRALIKLVGECADGDGDGDVFGVEEGELIFPIQTGRRDGGVRQPVEGDVVQDIVARRPSDWPSKTREISASLRASWSRIHAARPTGESAIA